jgi:hypothetical protein
MRTDYERIRDEHIYWVGFRAGHSGIMDNIDRHDEHERAMQIETPADSMNFITLISQKIARNQPGEPTLNRHLTDR